MPAAKPRALLEMKRYGLSPNSGREKPGTRAAFGAMMSAQEDLTMPKGQQRSNREKKKPKQPPKPVAPSTPGNRWPGRK